MNIDHYSLDLEDNYVVQSSEELYQKNGRMVDQKIRSNGVDGINRSFYRSENGGEIVSEKEILQSIDIETILILVPLLLLPHPRIGHPVKRCGVPVFAHSNGKGIASVDNGNLTDDVQEANKSFKRQESQNYSWYKVSWHCIELKG